MPVRVPRMPVGPEPAGVSDQPATGEDRALHDPQDPLPRQVQRVTEGA